MSALMCPAQPGPASPSPATRRSPVAAEYSLEDDLRFLSHHDEMRMLTRAIIRARWPVAYSGGFNPIPRLSIALPRPVGLASRCQLAVIQLTHLPPVDELRATLEQTMPCGGALTRLHAPGPARAPQPARACYEIPLGTGDTNMLTERIASLMARPEIWIARAGKPNRPPRKLNIRPYLDAVELSGAVLQLSLVFENQRSARPAEVLQELQLPATTYKHRVRLITVEWDCALQGARAPSAQEGTDIGRRKENQEDPRHHDTPAQEEKDSHQAG